MTKTIIILLGVIVVLIALFFLMFKLFLKKSNEADTYKKENENLRTSMQRIEENIQNANEQKESLNTGNDMSDFNNGIAILQKSAKSKQ